MRAVIQRVLESSVRIDNAIYNSIGPGLLLLLGIEEEDNDQDIDWLIKKIVNLRIFNDDDGVMNVSLLNSGGSILVISQFTLYASTRKGNRPSYIRAAKPTIAIPIYEKFIQKLEITVDKEKIKTGKFGADMKVSLLNNGPVTIIIDTKNKDL